MITIYKKNARHELARKLKERDLIITEDGRLFWVAFSDLRKSGPFISYHVTIDAEWSHNNSCWYRAPPGTHVEAHRMLAKAEEEEEAIDFSSEVKQHFETKQREIDRLEQQFLISVRMLADNIVDSGE